MPFCYSAVVSLVHSKFMKTVSTPSVAEEFLSKELNQDQGCKVLPVFLSVAKYLDGEEGSIFFEM